MKFLLKVLLFFTLSFIGNCDHDDGFVDRRTPPEEAEVSKIKKEVAKLQGLADQLSSLVMSDFASCPASGETADSLIRKICQVSQYANNESKVVLESKLSIFINTLQEKLLSTNNQLGDLQSSFESEVASINADLSSINSTLTTLESDLTTVESAITSLQNQVASLSGTIGGGMEIVQIGNENLGAGPSYESVLRRSDKTKINAYLDVYSSWFSLASDPINATNASNVATISKPVTTVTISNASPAVVTWTSHAWSDGDPVMFSTTGALPTGLTSNTVYYVRNKTLNNFNVSPTPTGALINTSSAGSGTHSGSLGVASNDLIELSGAAGGRGFTAGHLRGELVATSATTASITVSLPRTATSGGFLGGALVMVRRVQGRGLGQVWQTADGADAAVRQTTIGTKRYNFRIKSDGYICYSTVDNNANFATISAEGVDILCK